MQKKTTPAPQVGRTGFISQAQVKGGSGVGFTAASSNDPAEQLISQKVNEALVRFDKYMKEYVETFIKQWMAYDGFTEKKITDTPGEALALVNRAFVTQSGTSSRRPSKPVQGQYYFDTTLGIPIWRNGSNWVDSAGTTV